MNEPLGDDEPQSLPIAFTVSQAAKYFGLSVSTVYRGIQAGTIPVVQITPGGKLFVPRKPLERLLGGS